MKKIFAVLNLLLITATLIGGVCYYEFGGIVLKGLAGFGFVSVGIVNLIYAVRAKVTSLKFPVLIVLGLLFSMIGDVVLNIHFISGALVFAVGHLLYFTAYCFYMRFKVKDTIPIAVLFIASVMIITLIPFLDFGSALMRNICLGYGFVISCMVGKTISNLLRARNTVNIILTVGSILFYFSDLMLVFSAFGDAPRITDMLCLFTYFPAQCFLAHSIYHLTRKEKTV